MAMFPRSVHFAITATDEAALKAICEARGISTTPPPEGAIVAILRGALQLQADILLRAPAVRDGGPFPALDPDPLSKAGVTQ